MSDTALSYCFGDQCGKGHAGRKVARADGS